MLQPPVLPAPPPGEPGAQPETGGTARPPAQTRHCKQQVDTQVNVCDTTQGMPDDRYDFTDVLALSEVPGKQGPEGDDCGYRPQPSVTLVLAACRSPSDTGLALG